MMIYLYLGLYNFVPKLFRGDRGSNPLAPIKNPLVLYECPGVHLPFI